MLILNHPLITPLNIAYADSQDKILNTLPRDFLLLRCQNFQETLKLAKFCQDNNLSYASLVSSIKEALLLVNVNVRFLICTDVQLAQSLQKLAESYLFDTKILLCIRESDFNQEGFLEKVAHCGIDGVIFADL